MMEDNTLSIRDYQARGRIQQSRSMVLKSVGIAKCGWIASNFVHVGLGVATVGVMIPISIAVRTRSVYIVNRREQRCKDNLKLAKWTAKTVEAALRKALKKQNLKAEKITAIAEGLKLVEGIRDRLNIVNYEEEILKLIALEEGKIPEGIEQSSWAKDEWPIYLGLASACYTVANGLSIHETGMGLISFIGGNEYQELLVHASDALLVL